MTVHRPSQFVLYGDGQRAIEPEFVHIETISERSSLHNWAIAPHIHPAIFQVLFMTEGGGWLARDGTELALEPPALVIIPCGCVHAFRFTRDAHGWVLSVADALADNERLAPLAAGSVLRGNRILPLALGGSKSQGDLLAGLMAELARRHGEAPGNLSGSTLPLLALILAMVEESAVAAQAEPRGEHGRRLALVRRFTRLVERNFARHWPVSRYAEELGTTTPTLTRACRDVTGKPPGRIVLDRLVREAMRSLSYSTASISEISDDLGFADPAYFARVFRRHSGVTASAFRRERVWMAGSERTEPR